MKVIIRGYVFDYEEKAPFVNSGVSILGALEYDLESDRVRCHECGDLFQAITGSHLREKHDLTSNKYKKRHGLNLTTALCTPGFSKAQSTRCAPKDQERHLIQTKLLVDAGIAHKREYGNNRTNRSKHDEHLNTIGRCKAQTLFRLQVLAAELGRTPTSKELAAAKFDQPMMLKYFGSYKNALEQAGLPRRPFGARRDDPTCNLPNGFPSKEALLEARMPWPKEYFGAKLPREATPLAG